MLGATTKNDDKKTAEPKNPTPPARKTPEIVYTNVEDLVKNPMDLPRIKQPRMTLLGVDDEEIKDAGLQQESIHERLTIKWDKGLAKSPDPLAVFKIADHKLSVEWPRFDEPLHSSEASAAECNPRLHFAG